MTIHVPQPAVQQNGSSGGLFASEQPIMVVCGPVTFSDGTALTPGPETQEGCGYLLYRRQQDGSLHVWDEAAKRWQPGAANPAPQTMYFQEDRWRAVLLPAGKEDAAKNPKYTAVDMSPPVPLPPATGFPQYFVHCVFAAADESGTQYTGHSSASQPFALAPVGQLHRAGIATEPEKPRHANEIRLYLHNTPVRPEDAAGQIVLKHDSGDFTLTLDVNGASIRVLKSGEIVLAPDGGQGVTITDDLTVEGSLTVTENLTVEEDLTVEKQLHVQEIQATGISNTITLNGNLDVSGDAQARSFTT